MAKTKFIVTGGAGFFEYGFTLGFEQIPREKKHSQNQHILKEEPK